MRSPSSRVHHGSNSVSNQMERMLKNLEPLSQNKKLMTEEENVEADASMGMSQSEVESPLSDSNNKGSSCSQGRVKKRPSNNSIIRSGSGYGYPCEICGKTFPSGQALGGHKRCHRAHRAVAVDDAIINNNSHAHTRLFNPGKNAAGGGRGRGGVLIFQRKPKLPQGLSENAPQLTQGIDRMQLQAELTGNDKPAESTQESNKEVPKKPRDFDLNMPYQEKYNSLFSI
ncbi:hypothetical protein COLO4_24487 [Corchorus olitorius]|uniref:C2H2-type domain-containing protein n=1 Tax=Corchorus olitorius TaxID=93759 RepID=A0A1R3I9L4_9ROSI|nr:hypothetical protein COLO4_24487 [Corchorus olitorius]